MVPAPVRRDAVVHAGLRPGVAGNPRRQRGGARAARLPARPPAGDALAGPVRARRGRRRPRCGHVPPARAGTPHRRRRRCHPPRPAAALRHRIRRARRRARRPAGRQPPRRSGSAVARDAGRIAARAVARHDRQLDLGRGQRCARDVVAGGLPHPRLPAGRDARGGGRHPCPHPPGRPADGRARARAGAGGSRLQVRHRVPPDPPGRRGALAPFRGRGAARRAGPRRQDAGPRAGRDGTPPRRGQRAPARVLRHGDGAAQHEPVRERSRGPPAATAARRGTGARPGAPGLPDRRPRALSRRELRAHAPVRRRAPRARRGPARGRRGPGRRRGPLRRPLSHRAGRRRRGRGAALGPAHPPRAGSAVRRGRHFVRDRRARGHRARAAAGPRLPRAAAQGRHRAVPGRAPRAQRGRVRGRGRPAHAGAPGADRRLPRGHRRGPDPAVLPAEGDDGRARDRRRRSPRALGPSGQGLHRAGDVHAADRVHGPDPRPHAPHARQRRRAKRGVARAGRAAAHRRQPVGARHRRAVAVRAPARAAGTVRGVRGADRPGDDGEQPDAESGGEHRRAGTAVGNGVPAVHRRFRHGVLVAQLPEPAARGRDQDRPRLHDADDRGRTRGVHRQVHRAPGARSRHGRRRGRRQRCAHLGRAAGAGLRRSPGLLRGGAHAGRGTAGLGARVAVPAAARTRLGAQRERAACARAGAGRRHGAAVQRRLGGRHFAIDAEGRGACVRLDAADARFALPVEQHGQTRAGDDGDRHQDGDGHEDRIGTGFHRADIRRKGAAGAPASRERSGHGESIGTVLLDVWTRRTDGERGGGRGARGRGDGGRQAGARNGAGRRRAQRPLQARPAGARRHRRRIARLRRHRDRRAHALRPHAVADGRVPGPDGRPVGEGRAERQGRRRVHVDGDPARRPGDDAVLVDHEPAALRDGGRGPAVQLRGPDDAGRDHRLQPVRREHHRGRPGPAPAERQRAGWRAPPGRAEFRIDDFRGPRRRVRGPARRRVRRAHGRGGGPPGRAGRQAVARRPRRERAHAPARRSGPPAHAGTAARRPRAGRGHRRAGRARRAGRRRRLCAPPRLHDGGAGPRTSPRMVAGVLRAPAAAGGAGTGPRRRRRARFARVRPHAGAPIRSRARAAPLSCRDRGQPGHGARRAAPAAAAGRGQRGHAVPADGGVRRDPPRARPRDPGHARRLRRARRRRAAAPVRRQRIQVRRGAGRDAGRRLDHGAPDVRPARTGRERDRPRSPHPRAVRIRAGAVRGAADGAGVRDHAALPRAQLRRPRRAPAAGRSGPPALAGRRTGRRGALARAQRTGHGGRAVGVRPRGPKRRGNGHSAQQSISVPAAAGADAFARRAGGARAGRRGAAGAGAARTAGRVRRAGRHRAGTRALRRRGPGRRRADGGRAPAQLAAGRAVARFAHAAHEPRRPVRIADDVASAAGRRADGTGGRAARRGAPDEHPRRQPARHGAHPERRREAEFAVADDRGDDRQRVARLPLAAGRPHGRRAHPARPAARALRRDPARARAVQPAGKRRQVHAAAGPRHHRGAGGRRPAGRRRLRRRPGPAGRARGCAVREIRARPAGVVHRRRRPGPGHLPRHRRRPRRPHARLQPAGRGRLLRTEPAPGRPAAAAGCRSRTPRHTDLPA
ncbi:hypothetical protein Lal_00014772 [Lupinus albus]|nr:hypothetical protein Lal_00014772 [Lupinus albus]